MHMRTAILLGAVAASGAAAAAGGDDDEAAVVAAGAIASFETVDRNRDGHISPNEAESVPGLSLKEADQDGDGVISRTEYERAMAKGSKKG